MFHTVLDEEEQTLISELLSTRLAKEEAKAPLCSGADMIESTRMINIVTNEQRKIMLSICVVVTREH